MTFTQLRTFALVAELGSLRAAAAALGRQRAGGLRGGRRAARRPRRPAVPAHRQRHRADPGRPGAGRPGPASSSGWPTAPGARSAQATSTGRLRVLATAACAEHVAGAVVAAFTRRVPRDRGRPHGRRDRVRGDRAGRRRRRHRARRPAGARRRASRSSRCRSCATSGWSSPRPGHPLRRARPRLGPPTWPGPLADRPGRHRGRAARRSAGPAAPAAPGRRGARQRGRRPGRRPVGRRRPARAGARRPGRPPPGHAGPAAGRGHAGDRPVVGHACPVTGAATGAARALQRFLTTPDATTRAAVPAGPADRGGRRCAWSSGADGDSRSSFSGWGPASAGGDAVGDPRARDRLRAPELPPAGPAATGAVARRRRPPRARPGPRSSPGRRRSARPAPRRLVFSVPRSCTSWTELPRSATSIASAMSSPLREWSAEVPSSDGSG